MMKKCPKCGSNRLAPILYGMPVFSAELEQQLKDEKLYLGGCCISDRDPTSHCFACGKNVGTPPILLGDHSKEDYRDIVTEIKFEIGGYFIGYREVFLKKSTDKIVLNVRQDFCGPEDDILREVPEAEWKKLLDRLYCKLYLHEWKNSYHNYAVLDGEQWELTIKLTGRRKRTYSGSNAYPPYWSGLKSAFRPYFKEAGINF